MWSEEQDARIFKEALEALQRLVGYTPGSMDTSNSSCLGPAGNLTELYQLAIARNKAVKYGAEITRQQVLSHKSQKRKASELDGDTHETLPMGMEIAILNKKQEKEKCYIRRKPNDLIRQD